LILAARARRDLFTLSKLDEHENWPLTISKRTLFMAQTPVK
jgi:hypothetical protein